MLVSPLTEFILQQVSDCLLILRLSKDTLSVSEEYANNPLLALFHLKVDHVYQQLISCIEENTDFRACVVSALQYRTPVNVHIKILESKF